MDGITVLWTGYVQNLSGGDIIALALVSLVYMSIGAYTLVVEVDKTHVSKLHILIALLLIFFSVYSTVKTIDGCCRHKEEIVQISECCLFDEFSSKYEIIDKIAGNVYRVKPINNETGGE